MIPEAIPNTVESITVKEYYDRSHEILKLDKVAGTEGMDKVIHNKSINRPALALTMYFKHFAASGLQVFGAGEMAYLQDMTHEDQLKVMHELAKREIPCMVTTRCIDPTPAMVEIAEQYQIPLFRTPLSSKDFTTDAAVMLDEMFSPRVMLHGTLLDIKGIGVLIRGASGVGKSECALALIERGYSLVADDTTYVSLLRDQELVGTSSELNRGYMECRGIGIINIRQLFGVRAVRLYKKIDLVITFILWKQGMDEERTGLEENYLDILGMNVPHAELPVRPGRDMARLVEVAAMVQALKLMGYDSAKDFNERLIEHMMKQSQK